MDEKRIEINNAKEEIREIVEKCNFCGLCKELDPVFRVLRDEAGSPRGLAILFSEKIYDKDIFSNPLSGLCKSSCPFKIDLDEAIRKARMILNIEGKEHPENRKMLDKILSKKNPYLD